MTQSLKATSSHRPRAVYSGAVDALRRISREEGIGGLYRGLLTSYVGLIHVAIHFPTYEAFKVGDGVKRGVYRSKLGSPHALR